MRITSNNSAFLSTVRGFRLLTPVTILLAISLLAGCASTGNVPVESRSQPPSRKISTHIVETGDTLYSIAWRYETDYKKLAVINGIRSPYTIYKGQTIRLAGAAASASSASNVTSTPVRTTSTRVSTTKVPSRATSVTSTTTSQTASSSGKDVKSPALPESVQGWNWPLSGRIVKSFGSSDLTRGITLDSSAEKDVKAAAEGVVVYSGSGVRGYGNFLILKHSDLYLSAYAYNSKLLAKEGDQVRQGQKIAVAGKDVDGKPRLYFEIRKDGKPVDPIRYLPKR